MYISQILVLYELGYTFYKDILIYVYTFLRLYWTCISYFRMKDYVQQVFSCSLNTTLTLCSHFVDLEAPSLSG